MKSDDIFDAEPDAATYHVGDLSEVTLDQIRSAQRITYKTKGASSHIEVLCRIKGVQLLERRSHANARPLRSPDHTERLKNLEAIRSQERTFQIAAFEPGDLSGIPESSISSVFVRIEHLLYRIALDDPDSLATHKRVERALRSRILQFVAAVPASTYLIFRGADIRSDDPVLGSVYSSKAEPNPELGFHGIRTLLENRWWMDIESGALRNVTPNVLYAAPFVTRTQDFLEFKRAYDRSLPPVIPFLESPSALWEMARMGPPGPIACVGLKDVAQFYFAADRGNPQLQNNAPLTDSGLLDYINHCLSRAAQHYDQITIYVTPESIGYYLHALANHAWSPSMSAGDYRHLNRPTASEVN